MVATSEAHDSGLCAADRATLDRFATDLRNFTLASPGVNHHRKSGRDAGERLPERNRCWFATQMVEARRAYDLTIDRPEAQALERILARCPSTPMEPIVCHASAGIDRQRANGPTRVSHADAVTRYDDNRNGRITCKEARRHGIAPGPPRTSGVPLHARQGWRRCRLRVATSCIARGRCGHHVHRGMPIDCEIDEILCPHGIRTESTKPYWHCCISESMTTIQ